MAQIIISHGVPASRFALLRPHKIMIPPAGTAFSRAELLSLLPNCDAMVACGALDRELLESGEKLKLVVNYGAGYDTLDLDAATALGVPVAYIPDSVTEATAELAAAHILALTRRVCELDRAIRAAESTRALFTMGSGMGVMPTEMTLGVVGMGRIGARVAEFGRFFGMRVVYHSREIKPFSVVGNARRLPLDELLRVSDVVTLHCPLTADTCGLIGERELTLMRPTAFLVNTARGKLVDEAALLHALEEKRLAGAALDVFETEPEVSERLKRLPNVTLTPHVGSNTLRTRNDMAEQCVRRILDAFAGRKPEDVLNPEVWPRTGRPWKLAAQTLSPANRK